MLRTGKEHLQSLRDGRVVYVGGERIDDVTTHPWFRAAAQTVAGIYDLKADPANRDTMTYEEDGGRHSIYFLRPRSRDDLQRRMEGHRRIAEFTFGMFGRSPDHVASFVTGMALKPDALPKPNAFADNLQKYYRTIRDQDTYVVYAVVPPQAARSGLAHGLDCRIADWCRRSYVAMASRPAASRARVGASRRSPTGP